MNAERLHAIAKTLLADMEKSGVDGMLQALRGALQNQISQPQVASHQQQVADHLKDLRRVLKESQANSYSPSWVQALQDMGVDDLVGLSLLDQLEEVFSANQITPSIALDEVRKIQESVSSLKSSLEQVLAGFAWLEIGTEDLNPGECEFGVLIPRSEVDHQLRPLGQELIDLNRVLQVFAEVVTGRTDQFKIRTLSSSDFSFYVELLPEIGACLAVAIERIVALYKTTLEIRALRNGLIDQGLKDRQLKSIDDHANGLMGEGVAELAKELRGKYFKKSDRGRANELETALVKALNAIANRIDRGFNVEVRYEPPESVDSADDESGQDPASADVYKMLEEYTPRLQFLKPEGAPILKLPEGSDGNTASGAGDDEVSKVPRSASGKGKTAGA